MADINYISTIIKIVEHPKKKILKNNIPVLKCRVQIPQIRKTKIVSVICWGNLATNLCHYYQVNKYIMIEGYLSLRKKNRSKQVEITVLKIYPFLLNSKDSKNKKKTNNLR